MAFVTSLQQGCHPLIVSGYRVEELTRRTREFSSAQRILSSVSHNAGSSGLLLQQSCGNGREHCGSGLKSAVVRCSASKLKKKVKEKKRSATPDKQWKFDELMLVWDDAFQKVCDDATLATSIVTVSRNGCAHYGRGCVLVEETVNTKPRGAASGFSNKSRYSSSDAPELPFYVSLGRKTFYVPLEFIEDPFKAPELLDSTYSEPVENIAVKLVDQAKLLSVLKGIERTRLQGLLTAPSSEAAKDAGGEEPYDPSKNEVVIMFAVTVDRQQAVGADVLRADPATQGNGGGETLWTLKLRDEAGSDFIV
ncbi:hypothetical protein R1sor_007096 [Riccia sorocarpa]|uniref:Uncharacterized protein n=1 Tax=Riccia sorocarpa TaxID=122646 RepID=A0ABD3HT43_9MARC